MHWSVKAVADFAVNIAVPGINRVSVELAEGHNATENLVYPVSVFVDGILAGRFDVYLDGSGSAYCQRTDSLVDGR